MSDGTMEVEKTRKKGRGSDWEGEPSKSETVAAPKHKKKAKGPLAEVRYAAGATVNMGNFESARVDIAVTLPAPPTMAGVEEAYRLARAYVQRRLEEEAEALMNEREG